MDYLICYRKDDPEKQWLYLPHTNRGCFLTTTIDFAKQYLLISPSHENFHDVYSYMDYVERLNTMTPGSLHCDQLPDTPYEFW